MGARQGKVEYSGDASPWLLRARKAFEEREEREAAAEIASRDAGCIKLEPMDECSYNELLNM